VSQSRGIALPIRWVVVRDPLVRDPLARFDPQAFLCTDLELAPLAIVQHFIPRWQVEVTFEEARRHLWPETQRQWSDKAVAPTTPVLLSLFSFVTLLGDRLVRAGMLPIRRRPGIRKQRRRSAMPSRRCAPNSGAMRVSTSPHRCDTCQNPHDACSHA
jgi:hypothetical protein